MTTEPPPRARMDGSAARVICSEPKRLVSMILRHRARSTSSKVWKASKRKALLTRTSMPPNSSVAGRHQAGAGLGVGDVGGHGDGPGAQVPHLGQRPRRGSTGGARPARGRPRGRRAPAPPGARARADARHDAHLARQQPGRRRAPLRSALRSRHRRSVGQPGIVPGGHPRRRHTGLRRSESWLSKGGVMAICSQCGGEMTDGISCLTDPMIIGGKPYAPSAGARSSVRGTATSPRTAGTAGRHSAACTIPGAASSGARRATDRPSVAAAWTCLSAPTRAGGPGAAGRTSCVAWAGAEVSPRRAPGRPGRWRAATRRCGGAPRPG